MNIDRKYLYELKPQIEKFETEGAKRRLTEIPLSEFRIDGLGPKFESGGVSVDAGLIAVRLLDAVIQGAEYSDIWRQMARVEPMDAPKVEVSLISPDDFMIRKGRRGVASRTTGGGFDRVELDCSEDKGLYRVDLDMSRTWLRDNGPGKLDEALRAAGQALSLQIATDIMVKYETDVDATMTDTVTNWGGAATAHYKALVKAGALIRKKGMQPSAVLVNPDEETDILSSDYFIRQDYARVAHALPLPENQGVIGYMWGDKPIISTPAVTAAKMTIACVEKAVIIGTRQDVQIDNYVDIRQGLEGAVISFQADLKSGKDAKGVSANKPTKLAWAVATGA